MDIANTPRGKLSYVRNNTDNKKKITAQLNCLSAKIEGSYLMENHNQLKLLRLSPTLKATTASYNQFSIGFKDRIKQTFCSLQRQEIVVDPKITAISGDNSLLKCWKIIRKNINDVDYDVIHIHNSITGIIFLFAIFPFKISLLKKTIFTLHNSWNVFKIRNKILNIILISVVRQVCTCGQSSAESLPKSIKYLFGHKSKAITNGFDSSRIDRVEKEKFHHSHFDVNSKIKVVCVGALTDTKNQIALLKVLNSIEIDAEILFLGEGKNKQNLIDYAMEINGRAKIFFKGGVSRDVAIEHMLEADVFISLSKGEGLPIAVLEAMYCGCFLILSKIPPHLEVSPHKNRSFFVDVNDEDEIKNSLTYVAQNIDTLKVRRQISKEHAIQKFDLPLMLDEYMKVYESISGAEQR